MELIRRVSSKSAPNSETLCEPALKGRILLAYSYLYVVIYKRNEPSARSRLRLLPSEKGLASLSGIARLPSSRSSRGRDRDRAAAPVVVES